MQTCRSVSLTRFIPHEFGHDTLNGEIQRRIKKYAERFKVIKYLQNEPEKQLHLEWVGLATGYPLDTNLINGSLGFDLKWHSATVHGIGTESFAVSS
ncbi:hypothetical protein T440DRAFT_543264 [Plenodomus tracheiphilus IPT5]|uniref:Uncharacterized protein n=1 Tax=Plenodomus tracheiphilus IPT5 TaxID=1408161 RepID=A0A6A7AUS3_9PLEO|nr:hypothetical protein T440DRAFT_543264 [Plenodomus tracheiphilus IPT5]